MKKTFLVIIALCFSFVMISCNDDDDNNNSNNTETEVETVSLKYLKNFCGKNSTVMQDSLTNNGYTLFEDTIYDGIQMYCYTKANSNKDTTMFALMCYSNYVVGATFATSNNNNSKLLTAFKTWSIEMFSWSNQYSNITYDGTINDSSYSTHNLFNEDLNNMDISLVDECEEIYNLSQNSSMTAYEDRNFDVNSMLSKSISKQTKSNSKMICLGIVDVSSIMDKSQINKVNYIIKKILK